MKRTIYSLLVLWAGFTACNASDNRYIDLDTGETVHLQKDEETGLLVDTATKKPVKLYVDTKTNDTIWGKTGVVVNGKLRRNETSDGAFRYTYGEDMQEERRPDVSVSVDEEGEAYKVKRGDYKKEVEKDGDITIKDGNKKIKIDGETGERKVKIDN